MQPKPRLNLASTVSLLDHPAISSSYFFPQLRRPRVPWPVGDLVCSRVVQELPVALLHFHGNGEVVADWADELGPSLARHRLDSYFAEYRGYGGSGGTPSLGALLDDSLAVHDAVVAEHGTGPVIVYGRSLGSLAAAHVAAHRSVAALVIESGIHDLYERIAGRVTPSELGTTEAALRAAVAEHFDQGAKIALSTCPVTVLHTELDDLIGKHHAERNAAAAGARGRLVLFPRGDHNTIWAYNGSSIIDAIVTARALPTPSRAADTSGL